MVNLMQWQETLYKMFMEKDEGIMIKKETVTKTDLLKVLDLMEASGIQYWLDGGWSSLTSSFIAIPGIVLPAASN